MKIEQLVAWVSALRSDKYTKLQGHLKGRKDQKDSFCVLGVLHDIMTEGRWGYINTGGVISKYDLGDYGLKIVDMNDQDDGSQNDSDMYTFDELADYIEDNKDGFLGVKHED